MSVSLFVSDRMTGDAGHKIWWWVSGEALAVFHCVFNILADVDTMTDGAITQMNSINITHGVRDMAGHATHRGRNHVMLR